ncbi:MAG: hypothetical protein ACRECV_04255 [Xanthobacteraceae bacterium]
MLKIIIEDLRGLAQRCAQLSRFCKQQELAHALEEVGILRAEEAIKLERQFDT